MPIRTKTIAHMHVCKYALTKKAKAWLLTYSLHAWRILHVVFIINSPDKQSNCKLMAKVNVCVIKFDKHAAHLCLSRSSEYISHEFARMSSKIWIFLYIYIYKVMAIFAKMTFLFFFSLEATSLLVNSFSLSSILVLNLESNTFITEKVVIGINLIVWRRWL